MGKRIKVTETLPIIIRVAVPQTRFDPDAVDTHIYCVNQTQFTWRVAVSSNSFTTVDEDTGESVSHGSPPGGFDLGPGQMVQVADVRGWEWDGHIGIDAIFTREDESSSIPMSYNLKNSSADFIDAGLEGRLIPGLESKKGR